MAGGALGVTLNRDGPQTPWGFRLHGGKDIGYPMVIQRVFLGSPSDGELQRGDLLLQVQGHDAAGLTHRDAYDLIKAAGTRLQLLIRRMPGAPQTPLTPTSPMTPGMHPFARLMRETEGAQAPKSAPMFHPMSAPAPAPQSKPVRDYSFSFLPSSPGGGYWAPKPQNQADSELLDYYQEKAKEKEAIVQQGYRTLPLIAPRPKTRHDVPVGSYLRFTPSADWKGRAPIIQPHAKPVTFNKYPTPTYSTIGFDSRRRGPPPGAPTWERPLDAHQQLVHHQYNSPLFLYSQPNVEQTIREQTGVAPSKPKPNAAGPQPPNQAGPLSPGGTLAPARPGTKLSNIVDITLSPTFQLLQEEEKRRSASPQPPPSNRPRTPVAPRTPGGAIDPQINSFGTPRDAIHQSGSFKALMSTLYAAPEVQQA